MDKLTQAQWDKLSPEQKRAAILKFQEPANIYQQDKSNYADLRREKI